MSEIKLMKGNEAVAEAAVRCGCDGYFGYPITPQTEIMETLIDMRPWETTGMTVLQAESEIASINMVYGAASCGRRAMTSSSSPGISLMTEGLSYLAGAELPCLVVNVVRGGPGLGTIQPAQSDYFQATKGGGHGDYRLLVLAPASVQEMYDFVGLGFDLAFKYRNPVMILSDGVIGQMMEKVELGVPVPRHDGKQIAEQCGDWATTGKPATRGRNIITSVDLDPVRQEDFNRKLQEKYDRMRRDEVRYTENQCSDADYLLVAYGSSARICNKVVDMARKEGIRVGLLRPVTLFPFPYAPIKRLAPQVKGILAVEMSMGQMVEDVMLAACGQTAVAHYGKCGGAIHSPADVYEALKQTFLL